MNDDGDTSDGEGTRIATLQRQARRRMINARHAPHESIETTTSLPEYTSSPPDTPAMQRTVATPATKELPPGYPQLTAEEADEERDEVGDVVRRVRVRRRRSSGGSGSDPYLDSLLARSVHALELSNALLQSSMTTHSSLSALLSQDDVTIDRSLDSHARFLASQIHASDTRRAWVDDIAHQLDTLDHPPLSPLGLSQSLPDSPTMFYDRMRAAQEDVPQARPRRRDGGLQQGDRPRSPPPRCMTQYTTAEAHGLSDNPDSILMPSTNGLRAAARVHGFVPLGAEVRSHSRRSSGSRNHSRKSSVQWDDDTEREGEGDGMFARQQSGLGWGRGMGSGTPVSPRSVSGGQMHSPRRSLSLYTHSPHASTSSQASAPGPAFNVYQHGNLSSPQLQSSPRRTRGQSQSQSQLQASREQYASHQPSTPVQPVLSAASAAPSTPAYNLLSAIAMRSPNGNSSDGGGTVRARGGSLSIADLTSPLRTTSQSDLGIGIRGQSDLGALVQRGPGIGLGIGRVSTGLRRARSATPTSRGNARPAIVSPVKRKPNAAGRRVGTATPPTKSSDSPLKSSVYSPAGGTSSPSRPKAGVFLETETSSPAKSKPPSRSGSSLSVSSPGHSTPVSSPSTSRLGSMSSPSHLRHPFLQPEPYHRRSTVTNNTQSEGEDGAGRLHKYRSADALRRILDAAKAPASEDEHADAEEDGEDDDERGRGTVRVSDVAKGKQRAATESNPQDARNGRSKTRPPLPTWSVIPRTGTTVAVEVVTPGGVVSIKGINGGVGASMSGSTSGSGSKARVVQKLDPLELPGEFDTRGAISPVPISATKSLASPARSKSAGPPSRISSLLSASLPKIPVFGKTLIPEEPPPAVEQVNQGEAREENRPALEGHPGSGSTVAATATISDKEIDGLPSVRKDEGESGVEGLPRRPLHLSLQLNGTAMDPDVLATSTPPAGSAASDDDSDTDSEPSHASLPLPPRMLDSARFSHRPSSLRLPDSPRPSSLRQPGSGASTPRSVTFSPLPPKHVSSGGRLLSEAKTRRKNKEKGKEKEKPGWFASWFGPLPSAGAGTAAGAGKAGYGVARRGWDNPRGMDDWQM